jgi:hypothetical protein
MKTPLLGTKDWDAELRKLIKEVTGERRRQFATADADMVRRAVAGLGPDSAPEDTPVGGVRMVFNIPSAYVPEFCKNKYLNAYDLGRYRVGNDPPDDPPPRRVKVDRALEKFFGIPPDRIYFGAVELNGSGVRFYGDICLALRFDDSGDDVAVLDRNSYDMLRAPLSDDFAAAERGLTSTNDVVKEIAGTWRESLSCILTYKVLETRPAGTRRVTTGQVSDGILNDEDYVEVLRDGSFTHEEVEEARSSAGDASREAFITTRERTGQTPSMEELNWRELRRRARASLAEARVPHRVVVSSGRIRG